MSYEIHAVLPVPHDLKSCHEAATARAGQDNSFAFTFLYFEQEMWKLTEAYAWLVERGAEHYLVAQHFDEEADTFSVSLDIEDADTAMLFKLTFA